jgi:hypothetical protein
MPESEDRAISGFEDVIEVGIADRLPSHRAPDN